MAYMDSRFLGETVPVVPVDAMERDCVFRAANEEGSDLCFLDQRIPRYRREILNVIGMGVTENIKESALTPKLAGGAHGFAIAYVRGVRRGDGAALHRHPTEEIFVAISGAWRVVWLEGDDERSILLNQGDLVAVPPGVFRGFRSANDDENSLLMAIVGGPDAGRVDWHPSVITEARQTGLSVDDRGNLLIN